MKQTIVIERKSFHFESTYIGNTRILKVTKCKKGFVSSIRFKATLIPWFCSVFNQAIKESKPAAFFRSMDDGNKIITMKRRVNEQGKFLIFSEILRNGKEFWIFLPKDSDTSGWTNITHILRRTFGVEGPPTQSIHSCNVDSFPPLQGDNSMKQNQPCIEVNHRDRDWAIKISLDGIESEKVWTRMVIGCQSNTEIIWEEVVATLCENLYLAEEVEWVVMDAHRALIVCLCESKALNLIGKEIGFAQRGSVEFS